MASVVDLSGNSPKGVPPSGVDPRIGGAYDLQVTNFRGAQQVIVIGAAAVLSASFANTARAVRIAPDGNIHWEIGTVPVATATSPYLGAGAVETLRVRPGEKISIIRDGAATGNVTITEDA